MLIVSWNVAALSTTVQRIDKYYGDSSKRRKDPSAVIGDWLKRHNADICCIQETKMGLSLLESRNEPLRCAHVDGYESFWSCCVDSSKRGFNGVATYCKKGTTLSADSRPLKDPVLDDQGRCVMTDHGRFVLFNVYVPAGGGQPLSYKMKFLTALRRAMRNQRENHNKEVILVGDYNIAHTKKDVFWGSRCLAIEEICREVQDAPSPHSLPKWKLDVSKTWPKIEEILKTKQTISVTTTNPLTKGQFEKFRMAVQLDGKRIYLGNHEEKSEYCESSFDFTPCYYECSETGDQILSREENIVAVTTVAELIEKIGNISWDLDQQKSISSTDGMASRASPPRKWLDQIIEEDEMVDCFRHYYPNAQGRFTCWDQSKNKRYENRGGRIDYTLIDKSLLGHLQQGEVSSLRCGGCDGRYCQDSNSEAASLCAATANGRFQPISFQGGGIIEASQKALDSQFGTSATTHIYTPPSFSDHIAVSVLLDDSVCSYSLELSEQDKPTRAAQPHKKVRNINTYFSAAGSTSSKQKSLGKQPGTKTTTNVPQTSVTKRKGQLSSKQEAVSTKVSQPNKKARPINAFFSTDNSSDKSKNKRQETKTTKFVPQKAAAKKRGPMHAFLKSSRDDSKK